MQKVAFAAVVILLALTTPALAFRSIDAQCDGNGSQVSVPKCFAWMDVNQRSDEPSNDLTLRLWLYSPRKADAVRFSITATDAFGEIIGSYDEDLIGDVTTSPSAYDGTGEWRLQLTGFPDTVAHIVVHVERVHFKDGTTWKQGMQGELYYPPTPSPSSRP